MVEPLAWPVTVSDPVPVFPVVWVVPTALVSCFDAA